MITTWMSTLYIDQEIVFPDSPWLHGTVIPRALTEQPSPTSYLQKDGWLTATITGGTLSERPAPTQYFYKPSNNWLITGSIATPAVTEKPTPTEYLQATA